MIAVGVEEYYERAVESISKRCGGKFKAAAIKGYARMANKCVSRHDHYDGAYPRCVCVCMMLSNLNVWEAVWVFRRTFAVLRAHTRPHIFPRWVYMVQTSSEH